MASSWVHSLLVLWRYLCILLVHKWAVIRTGLWINVKLRGTGFRVSWRRLFVHDFSKFGCAELWPYANFYQGTETKDKESIEKRNAAFKKAWRHHYLCNDHHPEYFVRSLRESEEDGGENVRHAEDNILRMPEEAVMEMVADWFGASLGYRGVWPKSGAWAWLSPEKLRQLPMRKSSFLTLCAVMSALGFSQDFKGVFKWEDIEECAEFTQKEKEKLLWLKEVGQAKGGTKKCK